MATTSHVQALAAELSGLQTMLEADQLDAAEVISRKVSIYQGLAADFQAYQRNCPAWKHNGA
jgi:hypothetical protein